MGSLFLAQHDHVTVHRDSAQLRLPGLPGVAGLEARGVRRGRDGFDRGARAVLDGHIQRVEDRGRDRDLFDRV